ncbi:Copine [Hexamita inflata]|uniref:Copine n=1 Tax=Hexamita inflata TaxID=28002 RepID=A0AA86UR39_9EUKA|nr:Copine [Hexamita inflata]
MFNNEITIKPLICIDVSQSASIIIKWCNIMSQLMEQFNLYNESFPFYRIGCQEELQTLSINEYLRDFTEISQVVKTVIGELPINNQKSFGDIIEKAIEKTKQYMKNDQFVHTIVFIISDAQSCNPLNDLWQVCAAEKYPITIILLTEDSKSDMTRELKQRNNFYQIKSAHISSKSQADICSILVKRHNTLFTSQQNKPFRQYSIEILE